MFYDNDRDSKSTQRFKNMVFLKMFAINEERDEMMPAVAVIFLILIIGVPVAAWLFG